MTADTDRADLALLFRRAGFGARPGELDAAVGAGWAATVDRLLAAGPDAGASATPPPTLTPAADALGAGRDQAVRRRLADERRQLALWWLDRMSAVTNPWPERLTWFWHGHFATSIGKVRSPALMLGQQQVFRAHGAGRFADLLAAVTVDPAMLIWLDGRANVARNPNENYARECMELFALGHGSYTETDVRELARAFTGWRLDPATGAATFRPARHDPGPVTALGHTGPLTALQAVALIVADPHCAPFLAARAWTRFAAPVDPGDPATAGLTQALGPARDLGASWRALFTSDQFRSPTVRTGLVKEPVLWLVGLLRAVDLRARDLPGALAVLTGLGQVPFDPPSVGGWPQNQAWLTTSAVLARIRFALQVATHGDISLVADAPAGQRPELAARLLGIDRWSAPSASALAAAADDPHRLVALAASSPEYLMA